MLSILLETFITSYAKHGSRQHPSPLHFSLICRTLSLSYKFSQDIYVMLLGVSLKLRKSLDFIF